MFESLFQNQIDAFIIESESNRLYFTQFGSTFGCVVITKDAGIFYTDSRYAAEARALMSEFTVKEVSPKSMYQVIASDLSDMNIATVGYEDEFLTVKAFENFKEKFCAFSLVGASNELSVLRLIKSDQEIDNIKKAQKIAELSLSKIISSIKAGISEKELRNMVICECLKNGADDMSFSTIVAFGDNTSNPHHHASSRKLEKADLILIDFGVKYNGYCSDMTRTFSLSEPSNELKQIYDTVLSAQIYALKNIKAGMTAHEADSLAREYFRANGYEEEFSHSLGHGVGIDIHEEPRIGENGETVLQEGMVITVEPGIYIEGLGGVRIEDMVVIREDGNENLTEYNKTLTI